MFDRFPLRIEQADEVISRVLQDEVVLLKLDDQPYYGLDEVGAHAWDYTGDPATIRSDFHALVAALIEAGLLKGFRSESMPGVVDS